MTRLFKTAAVFAAFCLLASPVFAQTYGEITGTVTDSTGAVIPGATVTVTNQATNTSRSVQTNEAGNYTVPFLNPGVYDLKAEIEGFKVSTQSDLILQVGDVARANFVMEIGVVTETVEVAGTAPLLQTSSTALGTVIEQQRIVELPLNGRNYLQLVKLSPNVAAEMGAGGQANSRQGGERANQALSIGGQRQQYNRFTLDGVENTDPNFNTFIVRPSVDALQEFKVQTGVYSAEFGKATSQINVTTRSGSNEFHGSVFEFLRNDKIQARPWDRPGDKNPFRRNQFGFTVGGPIVRNNLFFMANYEGLRERVSRVRRTTTADTAMRSGDFSAPVHPQLFDPDTIRDVGGTLMADPFPNNMIPASRIQEPSKKLLEFYPEPNVAGALVGDPFNYVRNAGSPTDWDQFTTRIDWNEGSKSQWFGRFSWGDETVTEGQNFEFQDRFVETTAYQVMLSNVRTFSPTVVNELRLGVNLFDNDRRLFFNGVRDVTSELGIPGLQSPIEAAWGTPGIGMRGSNNEITGWGEATGGPFINRNRTYQILDNMSWVRGNHTFRFGGEIADRRYNQIGNQFPRGSFIFENLYTADPQDIVNTGTAFGSYLLGWITEATRAAGIANVQFRQKSGAAYVEDSWKVMPTLTLTMGLRYEYTPPWQDRYRGIFNVQMFCPGVDDTGIDEDCPTPVLVRPGAGDFHEDLRFHIGDIVPKATGDDVLFNHALQAKDKNDFAPRFGIAWSPTPRWTVRTGYGVYYSQDTGNPVFDMGRNLGARESARSLDPIPTSNFEQGPWAIKTGGGSAVQCTDWEGPCFAGLYTFANDARRRTPYVHQYMLNVQSQVTDTLLFEAGYQGNAGHKLQRMYGFNMAVPKSGPLDQTSLNDRRPWPNVYGRIQTIANVVNSNYNALAVKVQQRYTNGLTYLLGYTWSRSIDNGSAIRTNSGDNLFPVQSYDLSLERGLSQFHTGQRLTASILYDLPVQFQNRLAEALAGGWQVGSIITLSDGTPFNGGRCGDLDANTQSNRGDATGVSPFLDNPTAQEFFRRDSDGIGSAAITCEVIDAQGFNELTYRQGNVNRNVYIGPGVINWDFSLMKNFAINERSRVQFRFESFNFANHPNWNNPNTNLFSRSYGVISSARTMRTNQFALKFIF